jgi:hypothetical protein
LGRRHFHDSDVPDFSCPPWSEATLITPCNSVCFCWNSKSLVKLQSSTGTILYYVHAEDTCGMNHDLLTLPDRVKIAGLHLSETGHLLGLVELVVGMKAVVTLNISTEVDLANGTTGEVMDIVLDPHKDSDSKGGVRRLSFPPAYILFKPSRCCHREFPGVPVSWIPIIPSQQEFCLLSISGQPLTITRQQLPLTPGHAYTDYQLQGQTIEHVVVNIG